MKSLTRFSSLADVPPSLPHHTHHVEVELAELAKTGLIVDGIGQERVPSRSWMG